MHVAPKLGYLARAATGEIKTMAAEIPAPAADEGTAKGKSKRKLLMIGGAVIVLLAAGGGAFFWLHAGTPHKAAAPKPAAVQPPVYLALDPPFVVNFDPDQAVRFLQITVQLMSRDPATIELLKANDPAVRNELLLLFGNQKYTTLSTRAGKETLRDQALASVRKIIAGVGGHAEGVEAVYFTSFVMQ
jgi:flagellar FliL protein